MAARLLLPFLFLIVLASAAYYEDTYEQLKPKLTGEKMTWQHGLNKYFKGTSRAHVKRLLGEMPTPRSAQLPVRFPRKTTATLPVNFDARRKWPHCKWMRLIRDQSNCGSCWAVSTTSVMSDRHCVFSNGTEQPYISDEYVLSCCTECGKGCGGGFQVIAYIYWKNHGIPTGGPFGSTFGCQPYTIFCPGCEEAPTPACRKNTCIPQYKVPFQQSLYYGAATYRIPNVEMAMQEIHNNGPITMSFRVYNDFLFYKQGVYQHVNGSWLGKHSVRVIGWGTEYSYGKALPYWLITNSWNETWGMRGVLKILRGKNECGIEYNMYTGVPRIYV